MSIKKIALIALISTTALSAVAAEDYFVKFNAGYAKGIKSNKDFGKTGNSAIFGLEAGTQLNDQLRVSASLDYAGGFKAQGNTPDSVISSTVDAVAAVAAIAAVEADATATPPIEEVLAVEAVPSSDEHTENTAYSNVSKTKLKSIALMLNASYDIADFNGFVPYATVGLGIAKNKTKTTTATVTTTQMSTAATPVALTDAQALGGTAVTTSQASVAGKTTTSFAGKLGLGVKYSINSAVDVDFRYQYQYLGKFKTANGDQGRLQSNQLLLGVAYKF